MIPPLVTPARSMDRSAAKLLDTYEKTDALE
jgi:hypothetical protein